MSDAEKRAFKAAIYTLALAIEGGRVSEVYEDVHKLLKDL